MKTIGIAWYRNSEDYDKIKALSIDGAEMPSSYEDWFLQVQEVYSRFEAEGSVIERAYIDPESFPAWCSARGLKINGVARASFADDFVASLES